MDSLRRKKAFRELLYNIPVNKKTNLPFIRNFISSVKNDDSMMNLGCYLDFMETKHKIHWQFSKYNLQSFAEYIEETDPVSKNS